MKKSEPREVATLASQLAGERMPLEVQHFGMKLLQHLVSLHAQAEHDPRHGTLP